MRDDPLPSLRVAWADAASRSTRRAAGDALLRRTIAALGGPHDAVVARRCGDCGSVDHGAPYVVDAPYVVSVGYAGSMIAAAAARRADAASVGVDIEPADRDVGDLAALFAPHAPPDLAGWTRIEAVLKADGRGLRVEPSHVVITDGVATFPGRFEVATMAGPEGFVVSVAAAPAAPG